MLVVALAICSVAVVEVTVCFWNETFLRVWVSVVS